MVGNLATPQLAVKSPSQRVCQCGDLTASAAPSTSGLTASAAPPTSELTDLTRFTARYDKHHICDNIHLCPFNTEGSKANMPASPSYTAPVSLLPIFCYTTDTTILSFDPFDSLVYNDLIHSKSIRNPFGKSRDPFGTLAELGAGSRGRNWRGGYCCRFRRHREGISKAFRMDCLRGNTAS